MVMKMKKILILICLLFLIGCTTNAKQYYSKTVIDNSFDTFLTLKLSATNQEEFDELCKEMLTEYNLCSQLFDIYHEYAEINNLKTVNDNAGIKPIKVDQRIIDVLNLAISYSNLLPNTFDVTAGAILKKWHEFREQGNNGLNPPLLTLKELQKLQESTGLQYLEINQEEQTVYLTKKEVSLDVGAIAKGYTAELLAKIAQDNKVNSGYINIGGNNRLLGEKLDGTNWVVGLQDPNSEGSILTLKINKELSIVTSGDYQRYYLADNDIKYHHIINLETLFPSNYYHSVTVITKDSGIADILSTALFNLPLTESINFIQKYNENHDLIQVIWILNEEAIPDNIDNLIVKDNIVYTSDLADIINFPLN